MGAANRDRPVPFPRDCPVAFCISYLGTAWTWEILWYLKQRPLTFGVLRRSIPGISAKVLTQRLRSFERHGLVERSAGRPGEIVTYRLGAVGRRHLATLGGLGLLGVRMRANARRAIVALPHAGEGKEPTQRGMSA